MFGAHRTLHSSGYTSKGSTLTKGCAPCWHHLQQEGDTIKAEHGHFHLLNKLLSYWN